ncbi:hypothetical protein [Spiroplasma endosymbiont of Aleiodes alternator]|uniref:hypothetical protein n=1 Tax=Spiroplasma endosymbiont of Aleiodes alternator TaxID=3139329 RepID=UPI003CCB280A
MGKFLKLITNGFMTGVSETWCNNEGVAVLPFVYKYNQYWFLLMKEKNPLFENKKISFFSTLTGGCKLGKSSLETVKNEILEETGINIRSLKLDCIYRLGSYYANKTSIKIWHFYAVDLSSLNLDLKLSYFGKGDGSIGENGINGIFINESELDKVNDALTLAIYGKLWLNNTIVNINK